MAKKPILQAGQFGVRLKVVSSTGRLSSTWEPDVFNSAADAEDHVDHWVSREYVVAEVVDHSGKVAFKTCMS